MAAKEKPVMDEQPVTCTISEGIATLVLQRPSGYNTLQSNTIAALHALLNELADDADARVIVIASTGKAFSTGHDLKEMAASGDEMFYRQLLSDCSAMMQAIVAQPQPVIAQVQGIATAAGCQLVAAYRSLSESIGGLTVRRLSALPQFRQIDLLARKSTTPIGADLLFK